MYNVNEFARMLSGAIDARSLGLDTFAEQTGINYQRIQRWCNRHPSEDPTSKEIAAMATTLEVAEDDIESWLSADSNHLNDYLWLLASALIPGLNKNAWMNKEDEDENVIGLEQALILLVMKYRPGIVASKAQELYLQTKEGREQQKGHVKTSGEFQKPRNHAPDVRTKPGRGAKGKQSALEEARRLLGG